MPERASSSPARFFLFYSPPLAPFNAVLPSAWSVANGSRGLTLAAPKWLTRPRSVGASQHARFYLSASRRISPALRRSLYMLLLPRSCINMIRSPCRHRNYTLKDQQKEEIPSWKRDTRLVSSIHWEQEHKIHTIFLIPIHDPYWICRNEK